MTAVQPPLDPSKLSNGIWAEYWLASGTTGTGAYYWKAPRIDINGDNFTYNQNHGAWQDSNGGYQGWWWANESDLTYKDNLWYSNNSLFSGEVYQMVRKEKRILGKLNKGIKEGFWVEFGSLIWREGIYIKGNKNGNWNAN